ncbi:CAAX prenyl protease 1 homolog isoform X1 [Megachile rotundata]|uniref:CAAX prenyl protease 1 homolog isoform X1 n=2 Tax=Megachile rotundata TaxID=143995 RepID=UPI000258D59C|nr:PREDICTED: CAAX prenyl protease 1 homolog isoform X1 [Megachile rotundata]
MTNFITLVEENLLYGILIIIWSLFLWKYYLSHRQKSLVMRLVKLPDVVERIMTEDVYNKSRSYHLDTLNFNNVAKFYVLVVTTVCLLSLMYYHLWSWSIKVVKYFGFDEENEMLVSVVCMFFINIIYDIVHLPLNIYSKFVVEQKHGFNKETPALYIKNTLLAFAVRETIAPPILCALIWIIKNGGDYFYFYLWIFMIFVYIFMIILYPVAIAPLFDKYTPLPDEELKKKIEALAASINYPLTKIFVVNKSKRTTHNNAYLYGFYKFKRIVLFDTLIKNYSQLEKSETETKEPETEAKGCETDEILAILAHELGHWKCNHTLKLFFIAQVATMLNIFLFAKLVDYSPMYHAFGFVDSKPVFIGYSILSMFILAPFNTLLNFLTTVIGRRFEFEADRFAMILGYGAALKRSLIKLEVDNLTFPLYDKLYSGFHHNHPTVLERLEALDKED